MAESLWDSFARVREQPTHLYVWINRSANVALNGMGITISGKYAQRDFVPEPRL